MALKKKENKKSKKVKLKEEEFKFLVDDYKKEDDFPGDVIIEEVEDDSEFVSKVKEFEKQHKNSKLINVYNLIGKPNLAKIKKDNMKLLKQEYERIIILLDKYSIVIHFQNEYPLQEKYRFITEEIFNQAIEKGENHTSFIYEDFHPEMTVNDEEEI